jgi:hypothetical protein
MVGRSDTGADGEQSAFVRAVSTETSYTHANWLRANERNSKHD